MIVDRRILLPAIAQVLALITPFVYLRTVVVGHGVEIAVASELILSITGFFTIVVDWSSTTFLSRSQARLLSSGAYFSILVSKLAAAFVLLACGVAFLTATTPHAHAYTGYIAMVMIGIALDPSWIYVGRGLLWVPPALGACRFGSATVPCLWGVDPILALALSFFLSSVIFLLPIVRQLVWPARLSLRLPARIVRRYYVPTITEFLTAAFSRLDTAVAAILLNTDQALMYAVSRKLTLGLLSVTFSSARLFYLERNRAKLLSLKLSMKRTAAVTMLVGVPCAYVLAAQVFLVPGEYGLILTLGCLALLFPLGYLKTLIQFTCLYQGRRYGDHLAFTAASLAVFVLGCGVIGIVGWDSAVLLALLRVTADAAYVLIATIVLRAQKVFY